MKLKKLLACGIAACIPFMATACTLLPTTNSSSSSSVEDPAMKATAPDYSAYTHQYDFYGYSGPSSGTWKVDDLVYSAGQDFRTVEYYKDYKDAGMTIYLPQTQARVGASINYSGTVKVATWASNVWDLRAEEWETTKIYWDRAHEAGIEKIIMTDVQLQQWSQVQHGMLLRPADAPATPEGEESPYTFQSEAEFDEAIAKCLAAYIDHPAFYGVMLKDEPGYACVEAYGQTYRAIKRVAKNVYNRDIFVQHNLLPMRGYGAGAYNLMPLLEWFDEGEDTISKKEFYDLVGGVTADQTVTPKEQLEKILLDELAAYGNDRPKVTAAKYEKYIEEFALSMGSDYVQFDDYPLRGTDESPSIIGVYIREMQVAANVAKKLGIDYYMVTQSFATTENDRAVHRLITTEEECRWLNNTLLAFGVSQISYYTYFAKAENSVSHFNVNEGSFVTRNGEKTDIYYWYQQIMKENQTFAPTKLNFKYQGSRVYNVLPLHFVGDYLTPEWVDNTYTFKELKDISVNKESVLITESYDAENNRYMYCVQNIVDAMRKGSLAFQTTTLTFDTAKYKYAAIYRNGERELKALDNGKLVIKNASGEAAFVIPY